MRDFLGKYFNWIIFGAVIFLVYIFVSVSNNASANPVTGSDTSVGVKIYFLDVGEGDAALISLPDNIQVLIDGGRDSRVLDRLSEVMPKFDKKIEYVVASHPDADHIGGLVDVLNAYSVGEFIESKATSESKTYQKLENEISDKKIPKVEVERFDRLHFSPEAMAIVLWPENDMIEKLSSNDSSMVLNFDYKGSKVIFTGDVETKAQNEILKNFGVDDLKAQVLKVSHHGAKTGLNEQFLDAVRPDLAVISVGENSYGHPTQAVLDALGVRGIKTLRTDERGTIKLGWDNGWKVR